jgi:hypothetical protein
MTCPLRRSPPTPPEMLEALKRISATGRYEMARKTRSLCSRIFRYTNRFPAFRHLRAFALVVLPA